MPHWPKEIDPERRFTKSLVCDLEGDGSYEVACVERSYAGVPLPKINIWNIDTGRMLPGWPIEFPFSGPRPLGLGKFSIGVCQIDPATKQMGILYMIDELSYKGYNLLYLVNADGSIPENWPVKVPSLEHVTYKVEDAYYVSADVDGHPGEEIVVGLAYMKVMAFAPSEVFVYSVDGQLLPGWPQKTDSTLCAPVICNLDHDRQLEIVTGTFSREDGKGRIYAWNHDGRLVDGWPVMYPTNSLASGDLDNDGLTEIIANRIIAPYSDPAIFNAHGEMLLNPKIASSSMPSVCDVDNDGQDEIVVVDSLNNSLVSFNLNGNSARGFPLDIIAKQGPPHPYLGSYTFDHIPISFGDVDGDEQLEMLCIAKIDYGDKPDAINVFAFDLDADLPEQMDWPMNYQNSRLSGTFESIYRYQVDLNNDNQVNLVDFSWLSSNWMALGCSEADHWCGYRDIDKNNQVDMQDLKLLLDKWVK